MDTFLNDEQLSQGGLMKIEAFVRTTASAEALRKAKQRKNQKADGIHTVTLTVPEAAKEQLKAVAQEISHGKSLVEAALIVTNHGQNRLETEIGQRVLALTGWRKVIVKRIGVL